MFGVIAVVSTLFKFEIARGYLAIAFPAMLLPRRAVIAVAKSWGRVNLRLLRAICGIDVMWAHAGTPGPAAVEGLDVAEYEKAMALNVTSAVFAAGEVVQHMRRRGGGALVFTASVSGLVGSMFSPVYSAGKFAVVGLTKSLAQRFAADRVRVNVVCPGPIDTPMLPGFIGRSDDKQQMAENQKKLMAAVPLGRIGRPEEVAHAVLWLASDDASYVTGISLPVDGGYLAR